MPPAKKKTDKAKPDAEAVKAPPVIMIGLGDEDAERFPLPRAEHLTMRERFAIRNLTGMPAEELWSFDIAEPLGQDRLAVWYWVAKSREAGSKGQTILPWSMIQQQIEQAIEAGGALRVGTSDDDAVETEGDDGDPDPEA